MRLPITNTLAGAESFFDVPSKMRTFSNNTPVAWVSAGAAIRLEQPSARTKMANFLVTSDTTASFRMCAGTMGWFKHANNECVAASNLVLKRMIALEHQAQKISMHIEMYARRVVFLG